jgi:hypothetical protein
MSISFKELLGSVPISDVPVSLQHNGEELLRKMNLFRDTYGIPMIITSGFRRMSDHLRIYSELAHKRGVRYDESKVPMGSAHLKFCAVDISDPDGKLMEFCKNNIPLLESIGLWCEEPDDMKRVHFQAYSPNSGHRFFHP